jgi:glycosyltransferase involved in cell wall biosynthesis
MKVLTHHAHSTYQTELSKIKGVEFYHVEDPNKILPDRSRPWSFWPAGETPPSNIHAINAEDVVAADFDVMLIHWHPLLEEFTRRWKLPTIFLEHTWPMNNSLYEIEFWGKKRHELVDHTVFITKTSRDAWKETGDDSSFIRHSVDQKKFPQRIGYINSGIVCTACNEFINRNWACGFSLWCNVLGVPVSPYFKDICLFGRGNDNIKPFAQGEMSGNELMDYLSVFGGVYFNPSIMSTIPMSMLEAAAIGVPIVSTAYCEVGLLFKNDQHGIISNDTLTLREGIKKIISEPDYGLQLASNAKDVLRIYFAPDRFQEQWFELFNRIKNA